MISFKDFILEFAYTQSFSLDKIEEQISPLTQHIFKIWLMPKSRDKNHWENEIAAILVKIDRFCNVKNNKRISAKTLNAKIAAELTDKSLTQDLNLVLRKYKLEKPENEEWLFELIRQFYKDLTQGLEQNLDTELFLLKIVK